MKVSRLINGDWTFGKGIANYVTDNKAINQKLKGQKQKKKKK